MLTSGMWVTFGGTLITGAWLLSGQTAYDAPFSTSNFSFEGQSVQVETRVHPTLDMVMVEIADTGSRVLSRLAPHQHRVLRRGDLAPVDRERDGLEPGPRQLPRPLEDLERRRRLDVERAQIPVLHGPIVSARGARGHAALSRCSSAASRSRTTA